jgi:hypothetical protein
MSAPNKVPDQKQCDADNLANAGGHKGAIFLFEHDLVGKPASTFPDHALERNRFRLKRFAL